MAENPLTKLPLAGQLGVSAVIAALLCGGFYYFWYSDALETQKKQEARLAELQKQIRALEATANKLPEFQREVQALEARLETLKRILPPEKEMPDLMRRVQYLAAQSSLQIRKFNPAAPSRRTSTRRSRSTWTSRAPTTTWGPSWTASAGCPASSTWAT